MFNNEKNKNTKFLPCLLDLRLVVFYLFTFLTNRKWAIFRKEKKNRLKTTFIKLVLAFLSLSMK